RRRITDQVIALRMSQDFLQGVAESVRILSSDSARCTGQRAQALSSSEVLAGNQSHIRAAGKSRILTTTGDRRATDGHAQTALRLGVPELGCGLEAANIHCVDYDSRPSGVISDFVNQP